MIVIKHNDYALFRTEFDKDNDLIQIFCGVSFVKSDFNHPVDFKLVGLMKKDDIDCFRPQTILSFMTDEATPCFVGGSYIGANHGHNQAVKVTVLNHGLSFCDIGKTFIDEKGITFTLMRVIDQNTLLFLSNNVGESVYDYRFITEVCGSLNSQDKTIIPTAFCSCDLTRSCRYKTKEIITYRNGKADKVFSSSCDYAKIVEEYDIINPATVAAQLSAARPIDGYKENPDLSLFGSAMIEIKLTYQINPDGTVICAFDNKKLAPVKWTIHMGAMFQEKYDVFGGGVCRFIPKTTPVKAIDGEFDFNSGVNLKEEFPQNALITPLFWQDKDSPPDRVIDYFYNERGQNKLGFACGYLPLFDGEYAKRKANLSCALHAVKTKKAYPIFLEGDILKAKGVAYKKYFLPQGKSSYYTVDFDGKTYLFIHALGESVTSKLCGKVELLDLVGDITYSFDGDNLTANGRGSALFVISD